MRKIFLIVLLVGISLTGKSQDTLDPKWELAIDLYSLVKPAEEQLPRSTYGLMVKRLVSNNSALRLRTNFGFEFMPKPMVKGTNQPRSYNLSFDIGKEKQRLYNRFVHYYGIDAQIKRIYTNSTIGFGISGNAPTYNQQKGSLFGVGLAPFMGGKYMIAKRIGVSVETNLSLFYLTYKNTSQDVDINNEPITEKVVVSTSNGISFNIVPLSAIFLSYYF